MNSINKNNNYLPPVKHNIQFHVPSFIPGGNSQHRYGPFFIGKTQWQLEFRVPSFGVFLRRIAGAENGSAGDVPETLSFGLTGKFRHGKFYAQQEFTFTPTAQTTRIDRCDWEAVYEYSALSFLLEAFVRPENYAGGLPCDVRIVVLDRVEKGKKKKAKQIAEYAAHRSVLSKGSEVFKTMLDPDSKFEEAKTGVIRIGNFSPETIRAFLGFIYSDANVAEGKSKQMVIELIDAAEQYQVDKKLKDQCGVRLLELINCENAVEMASTAELYGLTALGQGAMRYIRENRHQIIRPDVVKNRNGCPHNVWAICSECSLKNCTEI